MRAVALRREVRTRDLPPRPAGPSAETPLTPHLKRSDPTGSLMDPAPHVPADSPPVAVHVEAPLQELTLQENPWLQEPLELQLTAEGGYGSPDVLTGAVQLEFGLLSGVQVAVGATPKGGEAELGVGSTSRSGRAAVAVFAGAGTAWRGPEHEAEVGLSAARRIGPAWVLASAGLSVGFAPAEAPSAEPTAGVGLILATEALVPFAELHYADAQPAAAFGLRAHPVEALELGAAFDTTIAGADTPGASWPWRVSTQITFEVELAGDDT